jgi:carnitine O-acetyltransferase
VVESALFVVCLDDYETEDLNDLCANFLCGSYELDGGVQVGTCTNRWYDKASDVLMFTVTFRMALIGQLQIIVCSNGEAGVNFEHTGVDGHTVLRYAADVYTELVLLFAKVGCATKAQCSPPTWAHTSDHQPFHTIAVQGETFPLFPRHAQEGDLYPGSNTGSRRRRH